MLKFSELAAKLEQRGRDYMQTERNRQRSAYMQSKIAGKITDWRPIDDVAFDAIDNMVTALAMEAGFQPAIPQQPAAPPPNLQQPAILSKPQLSADDEKRLAAAVSDNPPRLPLKPASFA